MITGDEEKSLVVTKLGRVRLKVRRKQYTLLSLNLLHDDLTSAGSRMMVLVQKKFLMDGVATIHPLCMFLQAVVRAHIVRKPLETYEWWVQSLELVECPPNTFGVQTVLADVTLWHTLLPPPPPDDENNNEEEEDWDHPTHALVRRLVARLERKELKQPRSRLPRLNRKVLADLEAEAAEVELMELREFVQSKAGGDDDNEDKSGNNPGKSEQQLKDFAMNLPTSNIHQPSAHGKLTRGEYLARKKHPQIAWFLRRIFFTTATTQPPLFHHILDVGGGRGDLAVALALQQEHLHVSIVDTNASSLAAARVFAEQQGVGDRMHTIESDFTTFAQAGVPSSPTVPVFDLVVALHACGDLSDWAMKFATTRGLPFIVCPCCFSKLSQQSTATRLAELSARPDISRRAMHIINSRRCRKIMMGNESDMAETKYCVELEEYDREWSSRNQVIIGKPSKIDFVARDY